MRTSLIIVATVVATATLSTTTPTPASAGTKGYAPFGEPPRTKNGAHVRMAMVRWYFFINNGKCSLTDASRIGRAIKDIDRMILRLPPGEQQVFMDYRNKLTRHFNAEHRGIPGLGTWREVMVKRDEALKWYPANKPKGTPKTDAEFAAYAKSIKAYRTRAQSDRAYLGKALAWPCAQMRSRGLGKWNYYVRASSVDRVLTRAIRENQPRLHHLQSAKHFLAKYADATYKEPRDYGRMLLDAVALYSNLQEDLGREKRLMLWAQAIGGNAAAAAKADLATARAAMKTVAALYAANIKKVRLPKKARSSKAQRIARRAVGKQVRVHATSGIRKVANPQSEVFRRAGKLWKRSWSESLDEVEIWYIARAKPKKWFVDMPGVPLKKVCSLRTAAAHRYRRGLNVKLNRWLLEEDAMISPILCTAK
jgi:hypothetical protein